MRKLGIFSLVLVVVFVLLFIFAGRLLNNQDSIQQPTNEKKASNMKITSSAFQNNQTIPQKYSCDGKNINPQLSFSEIPANAKSLVLIMDDPDAPMGTFIHWVLYNMEPNVTGISEKNLPSPITAGKNSAGKTIYIGPCPPSGTHRYFFKLYALDKMLDLASGASKQEVEKAMEGHILDLAELIGLYGRG